MIKATSIVLNRAEGPITLCGQPITCEGSLCWAQADFTLSGMSQTAPQTGGYDKVDFTVTYEDGETYSGRYDLQHWSVETPSLTTHMRSFVSFYAGRADLSLRPDLTEETYRYLITAWGRDLEQPERFAHFLDTYEIGSDDERPPNGGRPEAPSPTPSTDEPATPPTMDPQGAVLYTRALETLNRDDVVKAIRHLLKVRSGKAWSVRVDHGTASGWISISCPPKRRACAQAHRFDLQDLCQECGANRFESGWSGCEKHVCTDRCYREGLSPQDATELAALLGLRHVHSQGESIADGRDYYREYLDRAAGATPSAVGVPYWD